MSLEIQLNKIATITVTYHPELTILESQLCALPPECLKIVVDNTSNSHVLEGIAHLISKTPNALLLKNGKNIGLAAAINRGAEIAGQQPAPPRFLFFLDQDSEPEANVVESLVRTFLRFERENFHPGCIGANMIDIRSGLPHGFHIATHWRWKRFYPAPELDQPVACTNLNGSGTLVPLSLFQKLGGLDESLFIDHVDTEWSFRVLAAGHTLWGHPQARIWHRMGENSLRFWLFGWRIWPARSPIRHYYLFRNAVILMHRSYIPIIWKSWAVIKLALTFTIHALFDPDRQAQIQTMWRGVHDGFRRKAS